MGARVFCAAPSACSSPRTAPSRRAGRGRGDASAPLATRVALLLDRRQALEVAADARLELLRLVAHDTQLRLPLRPGTPVARLETLVEAEPVAEPGPFSADQNE